MAYYARGDYGTGGYYRGRGDPGLFSFAKRLVKKIPQVVGGFLGGGVLGAGLGAIKKQAIAGVMPGVGATTFLPQAARVAIPKIVKALPGIAAGIGLGTVVDELFQNGAGGCCPPGYHMAKDGSGRCVRNRRMNVCNPAALRRSIRRMQGFEKLAKRTLKSTGNVRRTRRK